MRIDSERALVGNCLHPDMTVWCCPGHCPSEDPWQTNIAPDHSWGEGRRLWLTQAQCLGAQIVQSWATGAECSNNENTNKHLTRHFHEAVKHLWNLDSVVDAKIIQISFSSSLSISFRIEEIAHCSWHQLGQAHDKYSGQSSVFAPERHWLDAGRLGTRSWPVEGLNRIILIAVFEGQQQHRAINYPSIYPAQAQAGQSWFGLKLITTCASVTCDRPAVNGPG